MPHYRALLDALSNALPWTRADLSAVVGVDETTVAHLVADLQSFGVSLKPLGEDSWVWSRPVELLHEASIRAGLAPTLPLRVRRVSVLPVTESTNSWLLNGPWPALQEMDVAMAEYQSAGRGRRGRHWVAPLGSSLLLSVSTVVAPYRRDLGSMTLAVGVAALRALRGLGCADLLLKWPNDIEYRGRKLGGILCELRTLTDGQLGLVVGVGINVNLGHEAIEDSTGGARPVTDVVTALGNQPAQLRARLAAALISEINQAIETFKAHGIAAFLSEWSGADALAGKPVRVIRDDHSSEGLACGVDADGALLVKIDGVVERVAVGDVSVRQAA